MQEGYLWPSVGHNRKGTKHLLTDSVTLNFARGLLKDPARVQTKFLKMLFEHSCGAPVKSGTHAKSLFVVSHTEGHRRSQ